MFRKVDPASAKTIEKALAEALRAARIPTADPAGPGCRSDPVKGASMDAKAKRKLLGEWLAKLQADLDMAVEQMPDDWDETELAWYLVHRAVMSYLGCPCFKPAPPAVILRTART